MTFTNFKPMLACNIKIENVRLPVMGSYKMEGVRAEFTPKGLFSRPMKRFNNRMLEVIFQDIASYCIRNQIYLEGEFYIHGETFSDISSMCRRAQHEDAFKLNVYIFDMYDGAKPFATFRERASKIEYIVDEINSSCVHVAYQTTHTNHQQIADSYSSALDKGFEGWVLKDPNGRYKKGRSTKNEQLFVRLKPEETYDGVVLEIVERLENLCESVPNELGRLSKRQDKDRKASTGLAAVAVVSCKDFPKPVRVSLSRGIKDYSPTIASESRAEIWQNKDDYIGKNIRFVGFKIAGMELPRSPRFDAWRTDLDG